jgi:hypothetical protein
LNDARESALDWNNRLLLRVIWNKHLEKLH